MSQKPDLTKLKVLVIDDELFMLDVLVRALRGVGVVDVAKASECGEAIGLTVQDNLTFDCIIADFNMKPMNGLQFLQRIRSGQEQRIPPHQAFIMLTGNARSEVVKAAMLLDVNAYLVKPVAAAKLSAALERVVTLKWDLKKPDAYKAVNIQVTEAFNDAEDKQRNSSKILPKGILRSAQETTFLERKLIESEPASRSVPDAKPEKEPIIALRRCALEKLREKMVLGEDFLTEDGTVLIAKGTTLSARMVQRLQTAVADRTFVLIEKKL
jgi:two-component system, chemotaxis family, chemotaxis protein CheY